MNMTREELKGKQTPGDIIATGHGAFANGRAASSIELDNIGGGREVVAYVMDEFDRGSGLANALLYAEAHNVANRTGMWPEDMEKRIRELEVFAIRAHALIKQCKSDAEDMDYEDRNTAWWDEVCQLDDNANAILNKKQP